MKKTLFAILCMISGYFAQGQDLHFSQFFASPLTLNPAETGNFIEDYRIGGNYKQQWPWANNGKRYNYRTFSAYGDFSLLKGTLPKNDWLGVGLVLLHDNAGTGNLSVTKIFASAAYHRVLGNKKRYYLSMGINAGFVQKGIDYDRLYFNSQWNDLFFDNQAPSGENGGDRMNYFDMAAGLNFTALVRSNIRVNVGTSAMHLVKPKESFYNTSSNRLGVRPLAHAGTNIRFSPKWQLDASLIYMNQKKASEWLLDAVAGYSIGNNKNNKNVLYFGTIYRFNDALAPLLGYQFNRIKVLMNYDINLSSLSQASNSVGGFEVSVVHMGIFPSSTENRSLPCPRL
ncbi:MAG: PorP/SprF family type IX secretion system membrane protein [Chitinophagales bacterium]|nr:PorP/SprF family type IX secretion system membrane protein [Chitinophagales bacterium]